MVFINKMVLISIKTLLIFTYVFFIIMALDISTGSHILNKINKAIAKRRMKEHPLLFSYIRYYNNLVESHNEIYEKDFLPLLKRIDYFYDNIKYFSQNGLKSRQLEVERQKQLLEDSKKDMEKVWDNAQEYYDLIEEYTKAHKISWADKYLTGFFIFNT